MPKNRGRGDTARTERKGKEGQDGSRGQHDGRTANEVARRPRIPNPSTRPSSSVRRSVEQGPDRAVRAGDRSKSSGKSRRTIKEREHRSTPRIQDTDSSDSSDDPSGTDTSSSNSGSASSTFSLPDPYNGKADQHVFDRWKYTVEAWVKFNKLPRKAVIYSFTRLVTGDALECFETYVTPTASSRKWKPAEVFEILQEHCFPSDYKMRNHRQLLSAKQGNLRVTHFATKLFRLAKHVPYPVSDELLAVIFYEGLSSHIRARLIMAGLVPGKVDLETMIGRASNLECCLASQDLWGKAQPVEVGS